MRIFVSALEPSSNLHLKRLAAILPKHCELMGVCDSEIGNALFLPSDFSVMGFSDVAQKILFLQNALKILSIEASLCDQVLLMDSSSFNIRLAKLIRKHNPQIPIMYYILPQVWAWKPWRAKEIESLCDKLASVWRFELPYYRRKARYVGHPLLDIYKDNEDFSNKDSNIFVFMPGSRKTEIKQLIYEYKILAKKLFALKPDAVLRLIVPPQFKGATIMKHYGNIDDFELCYDTKEGLKGACFAFICSGTATLEASLMQIPFVLVYKARWLDYIIARMFVQLNFIGLANIIYQAMLVEQGKQSEKVGLGSEWLHEELIQWDCCADNMLQAYQRFDYEKYYNGIRELRNYLGHGSAKNVAEWLLENEYSIQKN
ncbi:lipid-A-disaccharide synthase [Helicobacter aurati]|uniref:Lipid-A-disaccharide synthase n=2 Tax=Helicobacter aurati TaxID=137778 RepID=A0A3D8J481_9HELI|nr:lipid-A-disaccharide synthase [Helicobacter aurati]